MSDTNRDTNTAASALRGYTSRGEPGVAVGTLTLSRESLLVWSERMLEALERGNDRRKWHTLADKVWSPKTLEAALQAVVSNHGAPGIDGQTTKMVAANAAVEVAEVSRLLKEGRYEPKAVTH